MLSHTLIKFLRNPQLFTYCIMWMMILVFIGTLAQKDLGLFAVQNKYFSSWILWIYYFPTPGGRLIMMLIFINLLFFIFTKTLWKKSKIGILIVHFGALLLMFGGGLTAIYSSEGNIIIPEGTKSNFIEDYNYMELAIVNTNASNFDSFTIFDYPLLNNGEILRYENLPFEIEIISTLDNCEPLRRDKPAGLQYKGMLKNFILSDLPPSKEEHLNRPGIIFYLSNSGTQNDGVYGLYLGQAVPQIISINNSEYTIIFRKKRTYLPFEIELLDFKKVLHPGIGVAKSYSSDINLIDTGVSKFIKIEMNQPLRYKGYTFYQSSFIESPEGETTVLAVVKNYGRLFPYISSIVMCFGLMIHLILKLPNLFKKLS